MGDTMDEIGKKIREWQKENERRINEQIKKENEAVQQRVAQAQTDLKERNDRLNRQVQHEQDMRNLQETLKARADTDHAERAAAAMQRHRDLQREIQYRESRNNLDRRY